MAGVLQYAVSLKIANFINPMRTARLEMSRFAGDTKKTASLMQEFRKPVKEIFKDLGDMEDGVGGVDNALVRLSGHALTGKKNISLLQKAVKSTGGAFNRVGGGIGAAGGKMGGFAMSGMKTVGVLGSVAVGLGAITAAAAVTAVAFKSLKAAASFEQTEVSFRVLIGNAKEATVVLNKLRKFANSTPFEFKEVAAAGKKLLAMGSSTGQLTAELRALGDIAAGTNTPLEEISFLYGKMRSKGKLMAEELNQLMERGIPIVALLAKKYKVSEGSILEMASKGKIGFSDMQEAVIKLTSEGGKFHGMMQEQSKTTLGLWSTLKSAVDELYITLGTPINDAIKPMLAGAIAQIQDLGARTGAFFKLLAQASQKGGFADVLGAGLVLAASKFINVIAGGIRGAVAYLGAALPKIFEVAADSLFSENNLLIMEKTFLGIGNMLLKYLLKGAQALAEAVGAKGTAIKLRSKALRANVDSSTAFMSAQGRFAGEAGNPTAFDAGNVLSKGIQGLIDANKMGLEASREAGSKQLIDLKPLKEQFAAMAGKLDQKEVSTFLKGAKQTSEEDEKLKPGKKRGPSAKELAAAKKAIAEQTKKTKLFNEQLKLMTLQATGQFQAADALEREIALRAEAVRIAKELNLSEDKALRLAKKKFALQDKISNRKRNDKDEKKPSFTRLGQRKAQRKAQQKENREQRWGGGLKGISAFKINSFARKNKISFKEAKEKLSDATRAASPRQARRNAAEKAAREAATKAATEGTLLKIAEKMDKLAVA